MGGPTDLLNSGDLDPGEWRIAEVPGGWEFRARFNVPLSAILPRYLRRNVPFMVAGPVVWLVIFGIVALSTSMPLAVVALFTPLMLLASVAFTVITWPLRFGRSGGYRIREDGSHDHNYYRLRYGELKRTIVMSVKKSQLEVAGAVFAPHHLSSLRIVDLDDTLPGLVGLSFHGDVVDEQMLVPWPGVDATTAALMRDALLDRIDEEGLTRTSGSREVSDRGASNARRWTACR